MTALGDYLADDWRFFTELLRDVTFIPKTGPAAPTEAGVAVKALRRVVDRAELALVPVLATKQATIWHIWAYHLGAAVPKRLDVILDESGVRWVVQTVQVMSEDTRFRLACTREQ